MPRALERRTMASVTGWIPLSHEWLSQAAADRDATVAVVSYPVMAGSVLLGSILPVLPTGAIVAGTAALAQAWWSFVLVVALGAAAAFAGDVITFAVCRSQGSRALNWLVARHDSERLEWARDQMTRHAWRFIIVGRILPAGRIPVLLAAGSLRYPWKAFLPAGAIAALIWAALYSAVGVIGGVFFDSPLVAVGAAVVLSLLVTGLPALIRRIRGRSRARNSAPDADAEAVTDADAQVIADSAADAESAESAESPVRPARPSG